MSGEGTDKAGGGGEGMESLRRRVAELEARNRALERELRPFHVLADNVPDLIYFKDREGRFLWVNRSMAALRGVTDKSLFIGKTGFETNADRAREEAGLADDLYVINTGRAILDKLETERYPDGSPMQVLTNKIPLRGADGSVVGICSITRDVTSLKRAEMALAEESNLLHSLLQNIPDAVYFKDRQSRFVRVSKGIHLEGMKDPHDAFGKTDFDFFSQEHAQQAYDDEQEIMRTGVPIIDKVERETYSTGRPDSWVSTTKVPLYDPDGNITGLVGISRDVTERLAAQEAIRKAKEELEVRVQERTAALVQEIKEHLRTERALRENEQMLQDSNQRLESRVSQLNFLNSTAHRFAHFNHRRDLIPAILETFARTFPGIEAALCERGKDGYECILATTRISDAAGRRACERALAAQAEGALNAPLFYADRMADPLLGALPWTGLADFPVYAALPLLVEDKSIAVVQIFAPPEFAAWFEQEKILLNTLAAQAAISLSNANNFQEAEKKARLQGELEVAQDIQRRFTPQEKPSIPRINLKGVYYPAYEVGGDYLDYFQTDSGNWVVVIADVSGKGIPAALVMTMLRSTFRAEARYETSAKNLMCAVNELMIEDLDDKSFVTALCLIIDKDGKSMSYARAGHPPLLIQHAGNGNAPQSVNPKGLALGIVSGNEFSDRMEEAILQLSPGDRFLIFTDGLLEAMDSERKFYGIKRLVDLMSRSSAHEPEKVIKFILDDVAGFIRSEPYHDDLTMLAMEVTG